MAELAAKGLELAWGALHADRPGRPSLACDIIEPLRVSAVDRWVLCLCNQNQLRPEQFRRHRAGGFRLAQSLFGPVLANWERWYQQRELHQKLLGWINEWIRRLPTGV